MLPAHLQELLTAAVDGELTHAERRIVETLLHDSEEARSFHGQLLRDAQRLRNTPTTLPADDLASGIMAIINERGMKPTPLPMRRRSTTWTANQFLPWFSIATAAVVLIAVSLVSYLFFATSQSNQNDPANGSAVNQPDAPPKGNVNKPKQNVPKIEEPLLVEAGPNPREVEPKFLAKDEPRSDPEMLPEPRIKSDVLVSPVQPEPQPFKVIDGLSLSLLLPLRDLDQTYPKKQVREELKKSEIVRIDLFCRNAAKAAELMQAALKARGQQLIVDALAQDHLKKRLKTDYVFYTESLTADEIALILEALGAEDKKAEEKKAGEGQFDKFLLAPFATVDLSELARLLGVRPADLKLPKPRTAFDPRKSLESNTVNQLTATLPKSGASRSEKLALVLPNGPLANPQTSKEIKSFLEKRGDRKPGTVPLMLVLRTPG